MSAESVQRPTTQATTGTLAHRRARVHLTPYLLFSPLLLLFLIFYAPPVVNLIMQSFWKFDPKVGIISEWNLGNYSKFLTDPFYYRIFWNTIRISFATTLLCLLIGYPVAYYILHQGGRYRGFLILAVLSPLLVTVIIRAIGWVILLTPSGIVNDVLLALHVIKEPIRFIGSEISVIIGLIHVNLAFMVLPLISSLQKIDPATVLAARNLGASRLQAFLRITLPLSLPGVLAGSVIVFVLSAGAWVIPNILGVGKVQVMPTFVWEQILVLLNWPFGNAIAIVLLLLVSSVIIFTSRWLERGRFGVVFQ